MKDIYKEIKLKSNFFEERAIFFDSTIKEAIDGFKNDYKKGLLEINFENKTITENYSTNTLNENELNDIQLSIV